MWIIRQEPRWLTATCLPQEKRKKLIQKLERGGISTQMSIIRKGYISLEIGSLILSSSPLSSSSPFPLLLCTPPLLSLLSSSLLSSSPLPLLSPTPLLFSPILLSSPLHSPPPLRGGSVNHPATMVIDGVSIRLDRASGHMVEEDRAPQKKNQKRWLTV